MLGISLVYCFAKSLKFFNNNLSCKKNLFKFLIFTFNNLDTSISRVFYLKFIKLKLKLVKKISVFIKNLRLR